MCEHVTTEWTNVLFHALPGRRCVVIRSYWRNGEGWYRLRDVVTGEEFDSPDIFWVDALGEEVGA